MASWRQCAGAFYVIVDSQTAEAQGAPHAASEGEAGVIPVQIIDRDSKPLSGYFNRQQFIRALPGCGSGQPRHRSTTDFFQLPKKAREFPCWEFSRGYHDGLKFIPHGSRDLLPILLSDIGCFCLHCFQLS